MKIEIFLNENKRITEADIYVGYEDLVSVDNASCKEIYLGYLLDEIKDESKEDVLDSIIRKMRHGGKIEITGTDLKEVARQLTYGSIEEARAIELVSTYNLCSIHFLAELLASRGLKILNKRLVNLGYYISAERP